jgi:glucosyl-dolichyl phosphate glucuronosyltransferase
MQSLISLTFDDGLRCQFEQALPILNQHGLPATFFLVANTDPILIDGHRHPDWIKTDWSEKDIQLFKSMVQQGHEIGAHSVHHKQRLLDKNPKLEAEGSKRWIEDRVGTEISSYCYPFCHFTEPIKKAVINAGYKQARWGADAAYYPVQEALDHFKVDCRQVSKSGFELVDGHSIGKYGAENVGGWLRPGCWHVLMFHGIGTVNDGFWAIPAAEFVRQMAELANLRDSGAVEVVTFEEGARRLRRARSRVKTGAPGARGSSMNITVILCTYNRCQCLARALDSLAASILPASVEWEILVVDNNSSDQTREVVENFCLQDPAHLRYLFEPRQGLSYARNAGIREARGEILAFVDDDDAVEPGWLSNLTSVLHGGEWTGAGGRIVPEWPRPIPKWLSKDLPTLSVYGQFNPRAEAGPLMRPPYGGNMAYRKDAFERYGGFRVDLGRSGNNLQCREDIEFANRLLAAGERLWYEPRAVVRAIVPESRMEKSYALRWWYWYGRSEVADLGPPETRWRIRGVPLFLIRRLARWTLQWLISLGASRRFAAQRTVWYLFGIAMGCHKWLGRQIPAVEFLSTHSETSKSQTDGG